MDKNRIGGMRRGTSGQRTRKVQSIKGVACKFGGCAPKVVELTSGDLPLVAKSRLRMERSTLTAREKSAEGEVPTRVGKA